MLVSSMRVRSTSFKDAPASSNASLLVVQHCRVCAAGSCKPIVCPSLLIGAAAPAEIKGSTRTALQKPIIEACGLVRATSVLLLVFSVIWESDSKWIIQSGFSCRKTKCHSACDQSRVSREYRSCQNLCLQSSMSK
jgi:hypothetical protein